LVKIFLNMVLDLYKESFQDKPSKLIELVILAKPFSYCLSTSF
jgi:hypothetical protein